MLAAIKRTKSLVWGVERWRRWSAITRPDLTTELTVSPSCAPPPPPLPPPPPVPLPPPPPLPPTIFLSRTFPAHPSLLLLFLPSFYNLFSFTCSSSFLLLPAIRPASRTLPVFKWPHRCHSHCHCVAISPVIASKLYLTLNLLSNFLVGKLLRNQHVCLSNGEYALVQCGCKSVPTQCIISQKCTSS